jgi:glyoxylase-like metal-dependent hydrolase (beta-lactamase superfamily II)
LSSRSEAEGSAFFSPSSSLSFWTNLQHAKELSLSRTTRILRLRTLIEENMTTSAIPRQQAYGINRRRIGDVVVTLINDGFQDFSFDILSDNITANEAKALLRAANLPPIPRMSVNVYVVQDGYRTILIDGGDANSQRTGGRLHYALSAANIDASQIDAILLTHAHPDHVGGLAAHNATPLFPNSELILHPDELQFWRNDENFRNMSEDMHGARSLALNTFNAYQSATRTATSGEIFSGITIQPLPGHTPGHSGYLIASGKDSVLIWGDIVHWPDIQIPRPEVTLAFDIDRSQAAETRMRLVDRVATDNILIGGMHLNFPGFIRIYRDANRYAIHEERWSPDLL